MKTFSRIIITDYSKDIFIKQIKNKINITDLETFLY